MNAEYVERMINVNDRIYVDTATLMETSRLQLFINTARPYLHKAGKKLCVLDSVGTELMKHSEFSNDEKRKSATTAFKIIEANKDVFEIDDSISFAGRKLVFADADELSELIKRKADERQLLITNDRHLSEDAYSLNWLKSCDGYQIKVCYLDVVGGLQTCRCVDEHRKSIVGTTTEKDCYDKTPCDCEWGIENADSMKKGDAVADGMAAVLFLTFGFLVGKYGKTIVNCIGKVLK